MKENSILGKSVIRKKMGKLPSSELTCKPSLRKLGGKGRAQVETLTSGFIVILF